MLLLAPACGTRQSMRPGTLYPPECRIIPVPAPGVDTVTVALLDPVEPEIAPWARNRSERLLFHHLYETLISVDCTGTVHASLADSWRERDGGRCWEFSLRKESRFWDGKPVTAADVVRSWMHFAVEPAAISSVVDSAVAQDERTLRVFLARARHEVPRALSSLQFAVIKEPEDVSWPIGSGPYEIIAADSSGRLQRTITLRATYGHRDFVIRFLESPSLDARDLIQSGIDMMVTNDPAVLEYARGRPQLETAALPWEWTYALVAPSRVRPFERSELPPPLTPRFLDEIARDAVREDARGHRGPAWWNDPDLRRDAAAAPPDEPLRQKCILITPGFPCIAYDRFDRTARELAERIVALAAVSEPNSPQAVELHRAVPELASGTPPLTAVGVPSEDLESSIQTGSDFACIVKLPLRPADPWRETRRVPPYAVWLIGTGEDVTAALVPLIDTRAHLIARRGRFGVMIDWFGNALIMNGETAGGAGK